MLAATWAQVVDAQVDGAELGQLGHALGGRQMMVALERPNQGHSAAGDIQQRGDHPAVENALDEVTNQLGLHRQVHADLVDGQLANLDAQ